MAALARSNLFKEHPPHRPHEYEGEALMEPNFHARLGVFSGRDAAERDAFDIVFGVLAMRVCGQ